MIQISSVTNPSNFKNKYKVVVISYKQIKKFILSYLIKNLIWNIYLFKLINIYFSIILYIVVCGSFDQKMWNIFKNNYDIDNFIFKLHYIYSTIIMILFFTVTFFKMHFGTPIECDPLLNVTNTDSINNFCFHSGIYINKKSNLTLNGK